jgi:hypothetical protein
MDAPAREGKKTTQISSREKGANGGIKIDVGPTVTRSVWHVGRQSGCAGGASAPRARLLNRFCVGGASKDGWMEGDMGVWIPLAP